MSFEKERNSDGGRSCEILFPLHEIDSYSGEELKNYIAAIVGEVGVVVIIDFFKIGYVNSSGLRSLIQILKLLRENGKMLILVQLSSDMKRVFVHTNLDKLFLFHDTLQDAIESLKSRGA